MLHAEFEVNADMLLILQPDSSALIIYYYLLARAIDCTKGNKISLVETKCAPQRPHEISHSKVIFFAFSGDCWTHVWYVGQGAVIFLTTV